MATVSEINSRVAAHLNAKETVVGQYSRQLINAGLLPKSSGKAIADVQPKHLIRLILAVGIGGKYIEAPKQVEACLQLSNGSLQQSDAITETVEDRLLYSFLSVIIPEDIAPSGSFGHRQAERNLRYEFIKDWPWVFVHEDGMIVESFEKEGAYASQFNADAYASFSLSCKIFDHFQDLSSVVTAEEWGAYIQKLTQ